MRVLVTGGCGFIGSHIVDGLVAAGHEVFIVDNLSTGNLANLNPKAKLFELDVRDAKLGEVFAEVKPEVVYHEAAQIDIAKSIADVGFDASVNVLGTVNVLSCCRDHGVGKIIYASSAAVYGDPQYLPVDEKHQIAPLSFYGVSKYSPELYIKAFSHLYGLKYTILRYANVYGIRQDPKGEGGVVSIFVDCLLKGNTPKIFGDGEQTRDFVYVKDIAAANLLALTKGDNQIINVSTNKRTTVNELLNVMSEGKVEGEHLPARNADILHSALDNSKAAEFLGFAPKYTLADGLKETVEYYRNKNK